MNKIIERKINEQKAILTIEKFKNKQGDYSQIHYEGAIKALEEFPINDNIVAKNQWLKEKRVETKRQRNSEWWQGYSEGLDILTDILEEVLYNNED